MRDVVRRIDQLAGSTGARRVAGAKTWLGALSHLSAEHFREHFIVEARDTLAAGAIFDIEMSENADDPNAQYVRLESVELDDYPRRDDGIACLDVPANGGD